MAIEGEFLSADDLGPLGRLARPGEMRVLEEWDAAEVADEREWIAGLYRRADARAENLRRALATAAASGRRDAVREAFEDWTLEAAKLALCDSHLRAVAGQLEAGQQQVMQAPERFTWQMMPQIRAVTGRLFAASDDEIAQGMVFRAK